MIWIAVDAMGGDFAAAPIVDGALAAARHFDLGVVLVGATSVLESELQRHRDVDSNRLRLVEADEVVTMAESPAGWSSITPKLRGSASRMFIPANSWPVS